MAIPIYNNKAINIDGHKPICHTCGALLLPMPMLFISSLVSTTHFPYPNGAVILTFIVRR